VSGRWFRFKGAVLLRTILLCLLLAPLLSGCRSVPAPVTRLPPLPTTPPPVAAAPEPTTPEPAAPQTAAPQPAAPIAVEPVPAPTVPTVPTPPPVSQPEPPKEAWQPLARWAGEHGFSRPTRAPASAPGAYALKNGDATLSLTLGSCRVVWDGLELWLGYPPHMINGELCLHSVDAEKNLAPLVRKREPEGLTNRVIVLDPGHGGDNLGARSMLDGRYEKEYTLDWALRLKPLLQAQGWQVFLTRTNDVEMSLSNRIAFAETHSAALFVSLHFNALGVPGGRAGLETYCLTPPGLPSTLVRDYPDDLAQAFPNNAFDTENWWWAVRLHRALVRHLSQPDRGVRHARFMGVLRGQNRPAVLLEGGYLSNPRDARLIGSRAYRQRLAEAVAGGLNPEPKASATFARD